MIFQCNLTFQGCKRKSFDQHSSQTAVKLSGMVSILPLQVPTGNFTGTMVIGGMAGRVMGSSSKSKEDDSRARETSNKNDAKLIPEKRSQDIYIYYTATVGFWFVWGTSLFLWMWLVLLCSILVITCRNWNWFTHFHTQESRIRVVQHGWGKPTFQSLPDLSIETW